MNKVAWLLATQRKPGAVEMAQRAKVLLPERAALLDTLALAHESKNQLPEAIRVQQKTVGRDPKDPMLKLSLAKLLICSQRQRGTRPPGDTTYRRLRRLRNQGPEPLGRLM